MRTRGITMTGKGFDGMRESELRTLEDARVQAGVVMRLREKCCVIAPKGRYKSPALTGMPGGSREPCGLDGSKSECERLLNELESEEKRLEALRREGEKIINRSGMDAEMRAFCRAYFFERKSVERAAEHAGVSERTGWNYKAEIFAKKRRKSVAAKGKIGI